MMTEKWHGEVVHENRCLVHLLPGQDGLLGHDQYTHSAKMQLKAAKRKQ